MKFKLAFALHNHQPVGNFDSVFEEAQSQCYRPFLETIKRYPQMRFSLHQSGILWDWQKEHHPDFFRLVAEMVGTGQIELLSGAFFEPILPVIPDRDKVGQLQMLSRYLKDNFKAKPRGMWLAERVWEPHLPKIIKDCGIEFLPLDDTHFKYAGLNEEQLFGTYITEEAGKTVTLLPILQKLRYLIPFGTPDEVIEFLKQAAGKHSEGLAVYADDGEKFGVWPNTHKHCYDDHWLERFFTVLEQNADWLEVIPLGEAVAKSNPLGRVYLPTASYSEMLHWALPVDSYIALEQFEEELKVAGLKDKYSQFVRGGHWRGFLSKYPESNLMHKKMLTVSDLYEQVSQLPGLDSADIKKAQELLYAGQCNCPYWHGVFGGLYLPHLRSAIYRKLIEAETILRRLSSKDMKASIEDRDRDGYDDIIFNGRDLSMVICPQRGGQIVELCSLERKVNVADCLTRRREGYHNKLIGLAAKSDESSTKSIHDQVLTKEEGLEKLLINDWYLRRPLTDHFLTQGTTLDDFLNNRFTELGDFILEPFDYELVEGSKSDRVILTRQGHVWQGNFHCPLQLEKTITFPKQGSLFTIDYRLFQSAQEIMPITFAIEFDFNLLAPDADDRFALIDGTPPQKAHLAAAAEDVKASKVAYLDKYQRIGIQLEVDRRAKIWRLPIYTVSLSEAGFEKVFQGNSTLFVFEKALAANEEFTLRFTCFVGALEKMSINHGLGKAITHKV